MSKGVGPLNNEFAQKKPWPDDLHFEDAEKIEKFWVTKLDKLVLHSPNGTNNIYSTPSVCVYDL